MSIEVKGTRKPAHVIAESTATVEVRGGETRGRIIDAGLAALGETRDSLFGYGIRAADGRTITSAAVWDQTVTVYAQRD